MKALVSGSAARALLIDDNSRLFVLQPSALGGAVSETSLGHIRLLMGDAQDWKALTGTTSKKVQKELDAAFATIEALQISLIMMDSRTSPEAAALGARELRSLLAIGRTVLGVEALLYASPLPSVFNVLLALERCGGRGAERALVAFFQNLGARQESIRIVRAAWDRVHRGYSSAEDSARLTSQVCRAGLFRDLVLYVHKSRAVGSEARRILARAACEPLHEHRGLLREWLTVCRREGLKLLPQSADGRSRSLVKSKSGRRIAKDSGPVCNLCRREDTKLFLKGDRCYTDRCTYERRIYAPGQHGEARRRRKLSNYGSQLREKQKLKRMYGLAERQFRGYYQKATRMIGVAGENLLQLLERRLDNVIYRLGFASDHAEARQLVRHGHFLVNGKRVNIPSFLCSPNDNISVREGSKKVGRIILSLGAADRRGVPKWLQLDKDNFQGKIVTLPSRDDLITTPRDHGSKEFRLK